MRGQERNVLGRFCLFSPGAAWALAHCPPALRTLSQQGGEWEVQVALGVGWHPWKLRVAECPSEFTGENHRRENAAPACPLLGRPVSESTVKLGLDFWLLGLSQCWRVSIPDGWGLCFSGPTKATTASLGVPRLLGRGYFIHGQHSVPSGFVPQIPESLAPGTYFYNTSPSPG